MTINIIEYCLFSDRVKKCNSKLPFFLKQVLLTVERKVVLSKIDCTIAWPDASETDAFRMKIKQHDMCKLASRVYTTVGENKCY